MKQNLKVQWKSKKTGIARTIKDSCKNPEKQIKQNLQEYRNSDETVGCKTNFRLQVSEM